MADQHHLDLLKRGVDTWNTWKIEQPDREADLSGAHFERVSLIVADCSRTDPFRAGLSEANQITLNFRNAKLLSGYP